MFLIINLGFLRTKSCEVLKRLSEDKSNLISSSACIYAVPIQCNKNVLNYAALINGCIMTVFNEIGGYPTTDLIFQCIKLRKPIYDYIKIMK